MEPAPEYPNNEDHIWEHVTHMDAGPDENAQEAGISNLKAGPRSQIQLKTQTGFSQMQRITGLKQTTPLTGSPFPIFDSNPA